MKKLNLSSNNIGDVGLEALAAAQPDLSNNSIDDEGLQAFTMGMREQCTIESLDLYNNEISSGMRCLGGMSSLRRLDLERNNIGDNDEAMEALVEAMESLRNLEYLELSWATTSGLSVLAPALQSERCCLQGLNLCETNIEDSWAIALANGLRGNKSLTKVCFDHRSLTNVGWSAFERMLCDTSSINSTYNSNHTLREIGKRYQADYPPLIRALLDLNKQKDQGVNVPILKILVCHSDIVMTPLLEYELKLLPFVITWCERAQPYLSRFKFQKRKLKLSAVYQFIVGGSTTYAYSKKKAVTSSSNSRKRKINQLD